MSSAAAVSGVPIHCMQGRLLPPVEDRFQAFPLAAWKDELTVAPEATVDGIEWIYEEFGSAENPIASDAGIAELQRVTAASGTVVESLCADWFMDRSALHDDGAERISWLAGRCRLAGISRFVLPLVDHVALGGPSDEDRLVALIDAALPALEDAQVELHLETSLGPDAFANLLARVDHKLVKANYDSGNSASLGYDPREELDAYGSRIGSVHVKDRVRGGGTVALGTGDADLETVFSGLHALGFDRPLVLQAARGTAGDEVRKTAADAALVRELWARTGAAAWT